MNQTRPNRIAARAKAISLAVAAVTLFTLSLPADAATLPVVWTQTSDAAATATVDPSGNLWCAEFTASGIVMEKYSANYAPIASRAVTNGGPYVGIATDPSGNALVATYDMLTGLTAAGGANFVYQPAAPILAMTVDANGNVILAENDWFDDLVIEKLTASGVSVFKKTLSSTGGIQDLSLATDAAGNIIVAAAYEMGTINFGGGDLVAPGLDAMVLAKLTSTGAHSFSKIFNPTVAGNGSYVGIYDIKVATNSKSEILVTGTIDGVGSLVMGSKTITLAADEEETMFLAKFAATGTTSYAKTVGVNGVHATAITVDNKDNAIITGEDWSAKFLGVRNGVFVGKFAATDGKLQSSNLIGDSSGVAMSVSVDPVSNDIVATGSSAGLNYVVKLAN